MSNMQIVERPFVRAGWQGEDADPWGDTTIPVPDRFTEKGEPPVVTLTGLRPSGGIEVAGGTVRIRRDLPAH